MRRKKTHCRQIIAVVMTLTLVLGICLSGEMAEARAKKISLNTTKKTITVNKKVTLKVKNANRAAKWTVVSGKSYIKLSKKTKNSVVVTAKKAGTAKVQAKIGNKKYSCKITVKKKKSQSSEDDKESTPTPEPSIESTEQPDTVSNVSEPAVVVPTTVPPVTVIPTAAPIKTPIESPSESLDPDPAPGYQVTDKKVSKAVVDSICYDSRSASYLVTFRLLNVTKESIAGEGTAIVSMSNCVDQKVLNKQRVRFTESNFEIDSSEKIEYACKGTVSIPVSEITGSYYTTGTALVEIEAGQGYIVRKQFDIENLPYRMIRGYAGRIPQAMPLMLNYKSADNQIKVNKAYIYFEAVSSSSIKGVISWDATIIKKKDKNVCMDIVVRRNGIEIISEPIDRMDDQGFNFTGSKKFDVNGPGEYVLEFREVKNR